MSVLCLFYRGCHGCHYQAHFIFFPIHFARPFHFLLLPRWSDKSLKVFLTCRWWTRGVNKPCGYTLQTGSQSKTEQRFTSSTGDETDCIKKYCIKLLLLLKKIKKYKKGFFYLDVKRLTKGRDIYRSSWWVSCYCILNCNMEDKYHTS